MPPHNLKQLISSTKTATVIYIEKPECRFCELLHQKVLKHPSTFELSRQLLSIQLDIESQVILKYEKGQITKTSDRITLRQITFLPTLLFLGPRAMRSFTSTPLLGIFIPSLCLIMFFRANAKSSPVFNAICPDGLMN